MDIAGSNMDPVVESQVRITANSVRPHATEVVAGHLARTDVVNSRLPQTAESKYAKNSTYGFFTRNPHWSRVCVGSIPKHSTDV